MPFDVVIILAVAVESTPGCSVTGSNQFLRFGFLPFVENGNQYSVNDRIMFFVFKQFFFLYIPVLCPVAVLLALVVLRLSPFRP